MLSLDRVLEPVTKASSARTGYSVTFVNAASDIPPSLWDRCFKPPVEGLWWYETLDRSGLDEQFTFLYGLIYREGTVVGIAPVFFMRVPIDLVAPDIFVPLLRFVGRAIPSVLYQKTLFVGSPCSDEGVIGLLPGENREDALLCVQDAVQAEARRRKVPFIVWKDFPDDHATDLNGLVTERKLFKVVSFPSTVVSLPAVRKKENYFASLKASRRQNLKRKLRHSACLVDVDIEIVRNPDSVTLTEIFNLFWQTYSKAEMKFERLNRAFFDVVAQQKPAVFIVLREKTSNDMVAFMLCFDMGERLINKFIGIDYARPKEWLLYFRLWEAMIEWSLTEKFTSVQSGQTAYAPKIEMGHRLIPLTNYCKHRNPLAHAIFSRVAKSINWATLDNELALYLKAHPEEAGPHVPKSKA